MTTVKQVNFLIAAYNTRLMSTNAFEAVYAKEKVTKTQLIRLLYTAGVPIGGEKTLDAMLKQCDNITVRLN